MRRRRHLERKRLRGPAQRRAHRLLRTLLTETQQRDLTRRREFFVTGSAGGIYRLLPRRGRTERVEKHGTRWYTKASYCLHDLDTVPLEEQMPPADVTIGHLLLLSCDEPAFLATANAKPSDLLWNGAYLKRLAASRKQRASKLTAQGSITAAGTSWIKSPFGSTRRPSTSRLAGGQV
jgi:hypothetical protein